MKFLDAKRGKGPSSNKMAAGPSSDKTATPASEEVKLPPPPAKLERNATPAASRLADELGVDLSQVEGSGVDGLIVVSDVRSAKDKADSQAEG